LTLFDDPEPEAPKPGKWVCERCGKPGVPDQVTTIDSQARMTTGFCTGKHIERQVLIVQDFHPTERRKRRRPTTSSDG